MNSTELKQLLSEVRDDLTQARSEVELSIAAMDNQKNPRAGILLANNTLVRIDRKLAEVWNGVSPPRADVTSASQKDAGLQTATEAGNV